MESIQFDIVQTPQTVVFGAGEVHRCFLKPEEIQRSIVSSPVKFVIQESATEYETKVREILCGLLWSTSSSSGFEWIAGVLQDEMRMILSTASMESSRKPWEQNNGKPAHMKLKIFSNYFPQRPSSDKGFGWLSRLTDLTGADALQFEFMEASEQRVSSFKFEEQTIFTWIPEEMCWQADVLVKFNTVECSEKLPLGEISETFVALMPEFLITLSGEAICKILEKSFSLVEHFPGAEQLLKDQFRSDFGIVSKEGDILECHRIVLGGAVPCLLNSLGHSEFWTETNENTTDWAISTEAVVATLKFIYYGGTKDILSGKVGIVIEVLINAHCYNIQKLVDFTSVVLLGKELVSFEVEDGWSLFFHARNLVHEKEIWTTLAQKCSKVFIKNSKELDLSYRFTKLAETAKILGPVFVRILNDYLPETDKLTLHDGAGIEAPEEIHRIFSNLQNVSKLDCNILYDFFKFTERGYGFHMFHFQQDVNKTLALLLLSNRCNLPFPSEDMNFEVLMKKPTTWFGTENLAALFCLACKMVASGESQWQQLKLNIFQKMKSLWNNQQNCVSTAEALHMFKLEEMFVVEFSKLLEKFEDDK